MLLVDSHLGQHAISPTSSLWFMLLERDRDLELLADLLSNLETSGGKVVLIRGEAGIGKSALVKAFVESHADEAHIYHGTCDDLLTPQPLGPFWDISRGQRSLGDSLRNDDRQGALQAALDLLSALRPSILVLEDTQWADEATLDAILYLGRRIERCNGLLLLIYRDGAVDRDHPLRAVIGQIPPQNLVRIRLDRLSTEAVESIVGSAELDLAKVMALTDGNPLFVTEVLASGVDDVPSSVQDSVLARAAKLSAAARRVLDLVSVIPGGTEETLVDNILHPEREDITECARQGLLRQEDSTLSFTHELARRAVESTLSSSVRRGLNQQVLAELVTRHDLARLVHHAREADDVDSIIEFAPAAARAAVAIGSHREAAAHFQLLDSYLDRIAESDRAAILDDWARVEFYLDSIDSLAILARAIELHRSSGDDLGLARSLTYAIRLYELSGQYATADACITEALAILESYPPSADLASAVSKQAWLSMVRGHHREAIEQADQAIALAETVGDELTNIHALDTKGSNLCAVGDPDGLRLLEEARSRAEQVGSAIEETRALVNMGIVAAKAFDLELASDILLRAIETAIRYELPFAEHTAKAEYTEVLFRKGKWEAAEDLATEALATSSYRARVIHAELRALWWLQMRQGRPEARSTLDDVWEISETSGDLRDLVYIAIARAEYMWITDEDDPDLVTRLSEILDAALLRSGWDISDLVFWLWELGAVSGPPEGIAEPYRLVIEGRPTEAAALWDEMGMPYERALALMHGEDKSRLEALEIFETLGATSVAAKVRKALRDDGVAVPRGKARDTRRHAAGLTGRQAEVLQTLDEGLSNIEIADRLFVSPRTVEHHVSAILTKLDASTRDEAVSRARAQGLFPEPSGAPRM